MMMTIDEAIAKYEQLINQFEPLAIYLGKPETLDEDRQLAEWLRELVALRSENAKLRALVADMWVNGMCECDECGAFTEGQCHCAECEYHYPDRMRDLGIEVGE